MNASLVIVYVAGLVCIVGEGSVMHLLGLETLSLQWSLVLTAYVGLRRDSMTSMLLLLGWLLPMDWLFGGPAGLHAFGLVVVFFCLRVAAARFERQWNLGKVLLAALGAAVYHAVTALVFVLTAPHSPLLDAILHTIPRAMIMTAMSSLYLGWALGRLEQLLRGRRQGDGLLLS